jgi:hypothetical protein
MAIFFFLQHTFVLYTTKTKQHAEETRVMVARMSRRMAMATQNKQTNKQNPRGKAVDNDTVGQL